MSFLQNLIGDYSAGKPKNFDLIATELHNGKTSLQVNKKLMEDEGLSRLAAGNMVENVQRKIKMIKINVRSGAFFTVIGVLSLLFNPGAIVTYVILFGGGIQLYAGMKERKGYKKIVA
ncbi:hypothetical protein [Rhodohalobacter barkolensis]|uniref:Uncharacterized protein n=1 Tax=Rhodohalobacter barkolensis TaxID=2053187 RepID=A0A2N0VJB1_9BACT|nr:hypothetical protein [Rhodohalobacter barkolensis]PKD44280.1 hypothetical protein CWD77_02085 [Rhodohalobacter barkolensis]